MEKATEQLVAKKKRMFTIFSWEKEPKPKKAKSRFNTLSILFSRSIKQNLYKALKSLNQACIGLEEGETKEQINKLKNYTQRVILGQNPFLQEKENQEKKALKGLTEEVKTLCKEVAPIKETYAKRLKQGLPSSSSFSPSLLLQSSAPISSIFSPPFTSIRNKKKQLQERSLVLITDQKNQPLNAFST